MPKEPMKIDANQSMLLVIDLQTRLGPAIEHIDSVLVHNRWLIEVANALGVPVGATVQYPQGLGPMEPGLAALLPSQQVVEKIHFSAVADGCLLSLRGFDRPQIVITGTESHVCVLQTALDLLQLGKSVFVVEEAVGSRRTQDKALALGRLQQAGCVIVSREMVAFEWLHCAGTDLFRAISKKYLR